MAAHTQVGSLLGTMIYRLTRCHSPEKERKNEGKTSDQVGVHDLGESPSWPSILLMLLTQAPCTMQKQAAESNMSKNPIYNMFFVCLMHKFISPISGATREAWLCCGKAGDSASSEFDTMVPRFKRIQFIDVCVHMRLCECVFFLSWMGSRSSGGTAAPPYVIWNGVVWNAIPHGARSFPHLKSWYHLHSCCSLLPLHLFSATAVFLHLLVWLYRR